MLRSLGNTLLGALALLPGREGIRWETSIEAALAEARLRNAPLLVLLTRDSDPDTETTLSVFRGKKVQAFASRVVFVIGHYGMSHKHETKKEGEKEIYLCSLFDVSCSDHHIAYRTMLNKYLSGEYATPVHLFLLPGGEEFYRFQRSQDAKVVVSELERLLRKSGEGVSRSDYVALRAEIEKAKKDAKDGDLEGARKKIRGLVKPSHPEAMKRFLEEEAAKLKKD